MRPKSPLLSLCCSSVDSTWASGAISFGSSRVSATASAKRTQHNKPLNHILAIFDSDCDWLWSPGGRFGLYTRLRCVASFVIYVKVRQPGVEISGEIPRRTRWEAEDVDQSVMRRNVRFFWRKNHMTFHIEQIILFERGRINENAKKVEMSEMTFFKISNTDIQRRERFHQWQRYEQ